MPPLSVWHRGMTIAVADAAGVGCEAEDVSRETSVDRLVRLGEYAQEHVGLRVMRVDLSRPRYP